MYVYLAGCLRLFVLLFSCVDVSEAKVLDVIGDPLRDDVPCAVMKQVRSCVTVAFFFLIHNFLALCVCPDHMHPHAGQSITGDMLGQCHIHHEQQGYSGDDETVTRRRCVSVSD